MNYDRKVPTLVTFIDFKKAFDCVQFDILLHKIDQLGLDLTICGWIKDYLFDRKQKVIANNHTSRTKTVKQGVPQGSILGPLFYLIYANDIHKIVKNCGFIFYADDTALFSETANFAKAKKDMQRNLNAMSRWCSKNGIYMNVDKTKYMVFGSKCMLTKIRDFDLKINGQPLERGTSYHYLDVTLDPSLTLTNMSPS